MGRMDILKKHDKNNKSSQSDGTSGNMRKRNKRMPVWALILTDVLLTAVSLSIFGLFFYVLPQKKSDGTVISTAEDLKNNLIESDNNGSDNSNNMNSNRGNADKNNAGSDKGRPGGKGGPGDGKNPGKMNTGNTNTTNITAKPADSSLDLSDKSISEINNYSSDGAEIKINKIETGSDKDKVTYYVADVNLTDLSYFKTAFAEGQYGKNLKEDISSIAEENNAVLSISGDFYGNSEEGVVIRNGVLYRTDVNDADVCVLFTNGEMKTYSPSEFNADEIADEGAWQAWTFGPALLDGSGNILSSFNTTSYLNNTNPRCAIGYVSKGHYKFVVVDGRDEGYSKGVNLSELAQIMSDEGCKTAYNLDGGKSASMLFQGEYVNKPVDGGREISDIIYIGN